MSCCKKLEQLQFAFNTVDYDVLLKFYLKNECSFNPALSETVDIPVYVNKIKSHAVTFEAWDEGYLVAIVAGYFNDFVSKKAFITSVITCPQYQGIGVSFKLLSSALKYSVEKDFRTVSLEVVKNNEKALNLYEKLEFMIVSESGNLYKMEKINAV